jgi:DNA-binding CsgD family transcriptional regulator
MHSPAPRPTPLRDGVANSLLRRIQVICGTSFDAMFLVDADRRFRGLNAPAIDLLGSSRDAILRSRIDDFTPTDFLPEMEQMWMEFNREGTLSGDYEVLRGDGRHSRVEFRARKEFDAGEHLIVARPLSETTNGRRDECPLTRREREVLQLAANGRSVRDIAEELYVSVGTIKTHFQHIHSKLGVSNRAAAVASALRLGLID